MSQLDPQEIAVLKVLYELRNRHDVPATDEIAKLAGISIFDAIRALLGLAAKGFVSGPSISLATVDRAIHGLDESAACSTSERVLMASIMLGAADEAAIAAMGLPPDEVRRCGDRYRSNGIWDLEGVEVPRDVIEFWTCAAVGDGLLQRRFNAQKKCWEYQNTPEGDLYAQRILKKPPTKGDGHG